MNTWMPETPTYSVRSLARAIADRLHPAEGPTNPDWFATFEAAIDGAHDWLGYLKDRAGKYPTLEQQTAYRAAAWRLALDTPHRCVTRDCRNAPEQHEIHCNACNPY